VDFGLYTTNNCSVFNPYGMVWFKEFAIPYGQYIRLPGMSTLYATANASAIILLCNETTVCTNSSLGPVWYTQSVPLPITPLKQVEIFSLLSRTLCYYEYFRGLPAPASDSGSSVPIGVVVGCAAAGVALIAAAVCFVFFRKRRAARELNERRPLLQQE
jgi:hypothetical protein